MDITTILAILSALGGFEAIKWAIKTWRHRHTDIRIEETRADGDEFHLLREQIEFLQQQMNKKEERFAEQTTVVRKLNAEIIELTKKSGQLELELALKRCERQKCSNRQPQNGY